MCDRFDLHIFRQGLTRSHIMSLIPDVDKNTVKTLLDKNVRLMDPRNLCLNYER